MTEIMLKHAPPQWSKKRLGQLFRERREKVSDKDFLPLSVTKQGILPQLDTAAKTDDGDNRKGVRAGDFVINSRSDRKGSGGLSDRDGSVSLINIVLEPRGVEPRFAHHLLRSPAFQEEFYRWGHGIVADLWTTRYSEMKNILLAIPNQETQKAIADFLDRETARIDNLIKKKQQLVDTLEQARRAVTLRVFREANAPQTNVAPEAYSVGHFDDQWSVRRIKTLVSSITSGSRGWSDLITDEGELFLQSGNIGRHMDVRLENANRVLPQRGAEADRTRLRHGDILVCITGGRTGAVGFLERIQEPAYVNQHICLLRSKPSQILPKLLAHLLFSEIGQRQLEFFQYGLKQGLGFSQVGEVKIPVPPLPVQEQILSKIDAQVGHIDKLIERIQTSLGRIHEYRTAVITAAVTGQINVTTWSKHGKTDRRLHEIQEAMQA